MEKQLKEAAKKKDKKAGNKELEDKKKKRNRKQGDICRKKYCKRKHIINTLLVSKLKWGYICKRNFSS